MFKFLLQGEDINWMAIFGLITFVLLFVIIVFVAFFRDSAFMNKMARMPLEEEDAPSSDDKLSSRE